jgi:hypothetical protein
MGRFRQLSPDVSECGCMKAIILLKPGTINFISLRRYAIRVIRMVMAKVDA